MPSGFNRRDFLKLTGITAGSILLPEVSKSEGFESYPLYKRIGDARTICPFCSAGCGLLIGTDSPGSIASSEGDIDHPVNRGSLDAKPLSLSQFSECQNRLKKVMYRSPGSREWEVKSWPWAIKEIASRIRKTRDDTFITSEGGKTVNRTESLAWIGGASNCSEVCYLSAKLARSLGVVYIENQGRFSGSAIRDGLSTTFGYSAMTAGIMDIKNSDAVLVAGCNPAATCPASISWINKARKNGAKLIVLDPRYTRTAAVSDLHIELRSGTDLVFLGALINYTIANKLYNEEYIRYYTNSLAVINKDFKGPDELDGYFSGFDFHGGYYDIKTWEFETEEKKSDHESVAKKGFIKYASGLDEPHTVFSHLKKHFSRYRPEMVEKICGVPEEKFLEAAKIFCSTGSRDRAGSILCGTGQSQHSTGTQNIRAIAILQLLLGNTGNLGGGIISISGCSNSQGAGDMGLFFNKLPGYMELPSHKEVDFSSYSASYPFNFTGRGEPLFFEALMKAWFGDSAGEYNDFAYDYLPKYSKDCSLMEVFKDMAEEKIKGLICMGQNPAVSNPDTSFTLKALSNLKWLVVMDLFDTETSSFWQSPEMDPKSINTEIFLLPVANAMERSGSLVSTGRLIQWQPAVATAPGEGKEEIWILDSLVKELKSLYGNLPERYEINRSNINKLKDRISGKLLKELEKLENKTFSREILLNILEESGFNKGESFLTLDSSDLIRSEDRPLVNLVWDYGDPPDVELVAREINGYALQNILDEKGELLIKKGDLIDGFYSIIKAENPEDIACGNWLYSGYFAPADDGTGSIMPAVKRRGQSDPWKLAIYPYWGFTWPGNSHILYNRASSRPDGKPWSEKKALVWWDETLKKWDGYDKPDFLFSGLFGNSPDKSGPFVINPDGKGMIFVPSGLNSGPFPEYYEPYCSPIKNVLSSLNKSPVIRNWYGEPLDENIYEKFPIICTTFRFSEHWQSGTVTRNFPWLLEAQPELLVEISKELAMEKGIKQGDSVTVRSNRGEIKAFAHVTGRLKPLSIDGKKIHQIALPWHYGWAGNAGGEVTNKLTSFIGDGTSGVPEYKIFQVDLIPL